MKMEEGKTWNKQKRKEHSETMKSYWAKRLNKQSASPGLKAGDLKPDHDDIKHFYNDLFVRQVGELRRHLAKNNKRPKLDN